MYLLNCCAITKTNQVIIAFTNLGQLFPILVGGLFNKPSSREKSERIRRETLFTSLYIYI